MSKTTSYFESDAKASEVQKNLNAEIADIHEAQKAQQDPRRVLQSDAK